MSPALRLGVLALLAGLAGCGDDDDDADDDAGGDDDGLEPWVDPGSEEEFLGYDVVPELELVISDEGIEALEENPRTYVRATIVYDGAEYGPVGVRLKGVNSFQPIGEKPSFRVNVNEYLADATFFGLKDLTFNNMSSDPSMMHERLAYRVARDAGIPASRCNHAMITVNGEPYGLYANVETVKKRMVDGWFDDTGTLWEATDVDFRPAMVASYQLEFGDDDRAPLTALADALDGDGDDPAAALAAAATSIDLATFQRFWAFTTIVAQYDSWPHSDPGDDVFVYADPDSGKLQIIPWGLDETWLSADLDPTIVRATLALRCKADPTCFQAYVDATWELLAATEDFGLEAERVRVAEQIAPLVERDTRRAYDDAAVAEGQLQQHYFITGRRAWIEQLLPPPSGG